MMIDLHRIYDTDYVIFNKVNHNMIHYEYDKGTWQHIIDRETHGHERYVHGPKLTWRVTLILSSWKRSPACISHEYAMMS